MKQVSELLADIEKFKILINKKNTEIIELKQSNAQLAITNDQLALRSKERVSVEEDLKNEIKDYQSKLEKLKIKINESKAPETIIKTEYITVEKPVEVEKVVEIIKYVPVVSFCSFRNICSTTRRHMIWLPDCSRENLPTCLFFISPFAGVHKFNSFAEAVPVSD